MTILIMMAILSILAGFADGLAETLKWHPDKFFKRFTKANINYWHPAISWKNKWKNGDPSQGEKFWQSSKAFVALTDGYHLQRLIKNIIIFSQMVLPFVQVYISLFLTLSQGMLIFVGCYLLYTIGFSLIYDKLFK